MEAACRVLGSESSALVLTGGGFPAALFEIGAVVALDEVLPPVARSTEFDVYVGASAGAIVTTLLALGIPPVEIQRAARGDNNAWFRMMPRDVFRAKPLAFLLGATLKRSLKAWWSLKQAGASFDRSSFLLAFKENLPAGFLTLEPLRETVATIIERLGRLDRFDDLPRSLFIPAFDLDAGQRVVFGEGQRGEVPVSRAVAASCAIPGLFEPVAIDGKNYVDGATGETTHVDLAVKAGARTIVLINPVVPVENDRSQVCFPGPNGDCSSLSEKGFSYVIEQAHRISRSAKLKSETQCFPAEDPDRRLFLIQPHPRETVDFLRSPISDRQKEQHLAFGYRTARRFLASHGHELVESLTRGRPALAVG